MDDLKRNIEYKINTLLGLFPIVLLVGARQSGKTTLAKKIRPTWKYFDLEKGSDYDFLTRDFDFFFHEHPQQIIIDEAQISPKLFKELRGVIDNNRNLTNRFILTGSSSPSLLRECSDSLAGRVAIIEIDTMKINEIEKRELPPFYQLFKNPIKIESLDWLKELNLIETDIMRYFFEGTYPEPVIKNDSIFWNYWMENYYQTYVQRDIKQLFPKLDDIKYRRFIAMLAGLTGTIVNKAEVGRSINTSEVTVRDYLDIANDTFIWRKIPSYEHSITKTIIKMPKGNIRDIGLANYLLGIKDREMLLRYHSVGRNFESFVIEELIKGINALNITNIDYSYYRTKSGAEIDLIITGPFGILPIEVKFGTHQSSRDLISITKFVVDHKLPFGIVINNSAEIKMINEKIIQIPVTII